MIDIIIKWLNTPQATAISFAVGIIGLAYAFYVRGQNPISKRLYYRSKGANIVNKKAIDIPSLQIHFDNADIKVLTETLIHFWNGGNSSITPSDIPARAPIAVQVPDGEKILSCRIVKTDGPGVNFSLKGQPGSSVLLLDVNSIERGKGALLEILHTATSPSDAVIGGAITDYGTPRLKLRRITAKRIVTLLDTLAWTLFVVLILLFTWRSYQKAGVGDALLVLIFFGTVLLFGIAIVFVACERIALRVRRYFVTSSVWHYERNELSADSLKRAGDEEKSP